MRNPVRERAPVFAYSESEPKTEDAKPQAEEPPAGMT
jgi:hypothetical protein